MLYAFVIDLEILYIAEYPSLKVLHNTSKNM